MGEKEAAKRQKTASNGKKLLDKRAISPSALGSPAQAGRQGRFIEVPIGNIASISMRAFNIYSTFIDPMISNSDSEVPTLWDAVMQMTLGGAMGLFGSADSIGVRSVHQMSLQFGGKAGHHTIPVYLCGAVPTSLQPVATIDKGLHDSIHWNLDKMTGVVNIAGATTDLIFNKNKTKVTKPVIMRLARTRGGRGTLSGALSAFYSFNNLWGEGGDRPGTHSIGSAFTIYAPQYVSDRKKTSIYQRCSRTFGG